MRHFIWLTAAIATSFLAFSALAQQAGSSKADTPETSAGQGIGYPSVSAALDDLRARGEVDVSVQNGWTIINDRASGAVWSFTPQSHPAHPAGAGSKRQPSGRLAPRYLGI